MSMNDKLAMMANQIARNLQARGDETAIAETADHIAKFWDPRMRKDIAAYLEGGGDRLSPIAAKAVRRLIDRSA